MGNKWLEIQTVIEENNTNICLQTETSQTTSLDAAMRRLTPPACSCIDLPRPDATGVTTNHGGVAAVIVNSMKCKVITTSFLLPAFESLCFTVTGLGNTIAVLLIYRPRSIPVTEAFLKNLHLTWK